MDIRDVEGLWCDDITFCQERMSDNGITSIVFLPVCSKCLNIIWQTVDCKKRTGIVCGIPRTIGDEYNITPNKCPYCGRFINSVVIPTKLPFNGSKYTSRMEKRSG